MSEKLLGSEDIGSKCFRTSICNVLTELQALCADLASIRQTPPPPPFDEESWLPFGNSSQKWGVQMDGDRGRFWVFGASEL